MSAIKKGVPLLTLLSVIIFLSSCVPDTVSGSIPDEISNEVSDKNYYKTYPVTDSVADICILYSDTEFKEELVTDLVKEFNIKGISVTVDAVSKGSQYGLTDYDAAILLSSTEGFKPLTETVEYIKTNDYSDSIIYFSTYSRFNIPYGSDLDKDKIDAITSASPLNDKQAIEEVKNKIIKKTMEVLNGNR
jgi:hypothetical protein